MDVTTLPHLINQQQKHIAMVEVNLSNMQEAMNRATNESQRMAYRTAVNKFERELVSLRAQLRALESTDGNSSY